MFALVALGGNLAHQGMSAQATVLAALDAVQDIGFTVEKRSRLYQTPAYPTGSGPDYVNAAALLMAEKARAPNDVLVALAQIENVYGRQRSQRWGGRTLDLDLLAIGQMVLPDLAGFHAWAGLDAQAAAMRAPDHLILPHPRLHERAFVLVPLMDIAPDWVHPVFGQSVRHMHAALPPEDVANVMPLVM